MAPILFIGILRRSLYLLFLASMTSCLDFGDDIELVGAEITGKEIKDVAALTGIAFPDGTEPIGYYFLGSGIDRSLVLKVVIPEDKKEEFLNNEIFEKGNDVKSDHHIAKQLDWWKLDELTDRIDRALELPKLKFVECILGREAGHLHAYVTWFEM